MSLLLDALKKAEEAKRLASQQADSGDKAQPAGSGTRPELSLEPVITASTPASALPELSAHLDTLDADLAAVQTSSPAKGKPPATEPKRPSAPPSPNPSIALEKDREAVRNVFTAKRTAAPDRTPLWLGLAGTALVAAGIGVWFWWQLQSVGSSSLTATVPRAAPTAASLPVGGNAAPQPLPAQALVASAGNSPATEDQQTSSASDNKIPPHKAREDAGQEAAAPPAPAPDNGIRITRGEIRVNPALVSGYERLQANDIAGATRFYEQALRADPKNTDALLGMAALALKQGQSRQAERWYVKVLESNPQDVNALAGLVNIRGQSDPQAAESRLKNLLSANPESAPLNFALGNLYAGQRRWPDAQLAYFNAHSADPENPDYLFNLASSLDHMHLPKIALDYYRAALVASNKRPAGFDIMQVKARVLELQP